VARRGWLARVHPGRGPAGQPAEPVCHVSYYEADAFAHWQGSRLPTEAEWEAVAASQPVAGDLLDTTSLHPAGQTRALRRGVGVDQSAYSPYPGFRAAPGAVGEYNGKFMVNQYVLRGGAARRPGPRAGHVSQLLLRPKPLAFSGLRLAADRDGASAPRVASHEGR